MSVKQRLKIFIESQEISGREFCRSIGKPESFIGSMREGTSPNVMHKIVMQYPILNFEWLYLGIGDMLKQSEPENSSEYIAVLKENNALLKEKIDALSAENQDLKKALADAVRVQNANVG